MYSFVCGIGYFFFNKISGNSPAFTDGEIAKNKLSGSGGLISSTGMRQDWRQPDKGSKSVVPLCAIYGIQKWIEIMVSVLYIEETAQAVVLSQWCDLYNSLFFVISTKTKNKPKTSLAAVVGLYSPLI